MLRDVLRNGLEEMRLAKTCAAVDEERVVGLRGRFRNGQGGRVGEAVRRADHERVEGVLHVEAAAFRSPRQALDHGNEAFHPRATLRRRLAAFHDAELERTLVSENVAHCDADQAQEVALDPVASELARDDEHERVVVELETTDLSEPLAVGALAERLLEPPRDLLPKVLCRQLDLVLHRRPDPPVVPARRPA